MIDFDPSPRDVVSPPFLRWVGSKSRLLPVLRAALPPGRRLIEPFVGSASVFLGTRYPSYLLNDRNDDLINLYRWLQGDAFRFLRFARPLFLGSHPTAEQYERTRGAFNATARGSLERAVLFLWLNKTCFNGVCRYNSAGEFNVPRGDGDGPLVFPEAELRAFHRKSSLAELRHGDFRDVLTEAGEGDVIYCDPPYVPRSATASFTRYTSEDFTWTDQEELAELCRRAAGRGATVVISNSDTPLSRRLYEGAKLVSGRLTHMVAGQGAARTVVGEAFFLFGDARGADFWSMGREVTSGGPPGDARGSAEGECYDVMPCAPG